MFFLDPLRDLLFLSEDVLVACIAGDGVLVVLVLLSDLIESEEIFISTGASTGLEAFDLIEEIFIYIIEYILIVYIFKQYVYLIRII